MTQVKPQPKSITERVIALRQRREAAGIVRIDMYVHQDDAAAIRALAAQLAQARIKK